MDFVPTIIIKSCADVFGPLIARLANLSFAEGKFPDMFRAGQVTPLLKKPGANTADMSNYRPITNLNTIEKILERLAMNQLRRHMESTPNGAPLQSAYRAFHSTETADEGGERPVNSHGQQETVRAAASGHQRGIRHPRSSLPPGALENSVRSG